MRKLILLFVLLLTAAFVNAQDVNFNLSMTVDKYIEVTTNPIDWDFGTTTHTTEYGPSREHLYGDMGEWDLAYANCEFSVTISGDNAANQGKPRFVRQETGDNAGGFDILPTLYDIYITTNEDRQKFTNGPSVTHSSEDFPFTKNFNEAPHNGQIKMDMKAYVNTTYAWDRDIPARATEINSSFGNIDSADAGEYACTMTVTLTAL